MNGDEQSERERRPILKRLRPRPEPGPDPEPGRDDDDRRRGPERRRRFFGEVFRGLGGWWRLFVESPVVLRFIFWALFVLVLALILRTLKGNPRP